MFMQRPLGLGLQKFTRSVQTSAMESMGKEFSKLFKTGNHSEIIQKIESSQFKSDPEFLKLKGLCQEILGAKLQLKAQSSQNQAQYFEQKRMKEQDILFRNTLGLDS